MRQFRLLTWSFTLGLPHLSTSLTVKDTIVFNWIQHLFAHGVCAKICALECLRKLHVLKIGLQQNQSHYRFSHTSYYVTNLGPSFSMILYIMLQNNQKVSSSVYDKFNTLYCFLHKYILYILLNYGWSISGTNFSNSIPQASGDGSFKTVKKKYVLRVLVQ